VVPRAIDTIPRDDPVECRDTDYVAAIKRRVEADFGTDHAGRLGARLSAVSSPQLTDHSIWSPARV